MTASTRTYNADDAFAAAEVLREADAGHEAAADSLTVTAGLYDLTTDQMLTLCDMFGVEVLPVAGLGTGNTAARGNCPGRLSLRIRGVSHDHMRPGTPRSGEPGGWERDARGSAYHRVVLRLGLRRVMAP